MPYTKRQFVLGALSELGLGDYAFDVQSEELENGMRRLDAMIGEWNAKGIRLGYPLPNNPQDGNLDSLTSVPDSANEAVITGLALRLAPAYGKVLSRETKVRAKSGFDTLVMLSGVTSPIEKQYPSTLPVGAGNKPYRYNRDNFFPAPEDPVDANSAGELDFY